MNDRLTKFTKVFLDIIFYLGIAATVALPYLVWLYGAYDPIYRTYAAAISVIMVLSGIMALLIIFELRKMFSTVLQNDCFRMENVTALSRMGNYSFVIACVHVVRIFLHLTPSVLIVIAVFLIAGLFSKVLARVFKEAVRYKLDNDLTI